MLGWVKRLVAGRELEELERLRKEQSRLRQTLACVREAAFDIMGHQDAPDMAVRVASTLLDATRQAEAWRLPVGLFHPLGARAFVHPDPVPGKAGAATARIAAGKVTYIDLPSAGADWVPPRTDAAAPLAWPPIVDPAPARRPSVAYSFMGCEGDQSHS